MDKDDQNKGGQELFEDESAFEEAPEGAALPQEEDDAGEWHDQPVDDLAESGEAYVEEIVTPGEEGPVEDEFSTAAEEHPDPALALEGEEAFQQSDAAPSKQGGGMMKYLPYIGVGAVLLVLGFFGYQQMSNMMNAEQAVMTPPPMQTASNEPPPVETAPPPPPPPAATTPPPASASPPVGSTTTTGEYILNSGTAPPPASVPAPPSVPPPLPAGQLAPPISNAAVENIEQQLGALKTQLDDIKRNQERIDAQLANLQNAPPPPSLPDQTAQTGIRALEEKFAQLEQRVASSPPPSSPLPSAPKSSASGSDSLPSAGQVDAPAPKPKKKKTARKKASPLPKDGNQWQTPGSYRQAMPWILRSAQPGMAWISQGMNSELQRVVPGDKVSGLGTVVSVRMVAGRWLVEGTQGSVR
jgi:hypothetical protein